MPFCWMDENDARAETDSAEHREAATSHELSARAQLMRRLGYSKADALHRCLGNVAWAYSVSGTPAITPAKIRRLVGEAYASAG